jgi:hypothetical protein
MNIPLEPSVFLHEFVEIGHELVNGFSHVHMPNFGPYIVFISESCHLVFVFSTC